MSKVGTRGAASAAANLANLLPTGSVLIFEALVPSFTNNGECVLANKYLTLALIFCCSLVCFFSSFTDSFIGKNDKKLYYGIATLNGIFVFNDPDCTDGNGEEELDHNQRKNYRITLTDFVHAFSSLTVFLVFSLSNSELQNCFFPRAGPNEKQLIVNLPLGAGLLSSFLFIIFPTKRRGIGYGDMTPSRPSSLDGDSTTSRSEVQNTQKHQA